MSGVPCIDDARLRALSLARVNMLAGGDFLHRYGRVLNTQGDIMRACGMTVPVGARCEIETPEGWLRGEVIGFEDQALLLMAARGVRGVRRGAQVRLARQAPSIAVGPAWLGRVVDAQGAPLDGRGAPESEGVWPLKGLPVNPLKRARIDTVFDCGVRVINALMTLGRGMRVGLFAGAGVGKTSLLGMMARHAKADVVVIGMIGERGREIREFIEDQAGPARARSVVVAAPADETALGRVEAAYRAAGMAEYFRAQGQHVLLVVDSLTRLALALREIGLAAGEPAAARGFPPSVFAALAAYVERAGNGADGKGSVTAIYTVLVEGDDHVGDPVADAARAVLDGHIVLSRALAEAGVYPAVDVLASLSRPMPGLVSAAQMRHAARLRALLARRAAAQDIIELGAYAPGRDALLDEAMQRAAAMSALIVQSADDKVDFAASQAALQALFADAPV